MSEQWWAVKTKEGDMLEAWPTRDQAHRSIMEALFPAEFYRIVPVTVTEIFPYTDLVGESSGTDADMQALIDWYKQLEEK